MAKSKKKRKSKSKKAARKPETLIKTKSGEGSDTSQIRSEQVKGILGALAREPIAIGLALFVLVRPWKDGLTFAHFNVYFTGWIFVLSTYFMVRMVVRGEKIRNPIPVALFAGYLLIAFVSSRSGVDYDVSLRSLILLVSYFFIFVTASNAIQTRLAFAIVMGALVVTALVNTVWAVIHFEYALPYVRESIRTDPRLLPTFFGIDELTPELKNRLEMDRAFGTFLFPNAMGGFLALCVPYALGEGMNSVRRFRELMNSEKPKHGIENSSFAVLLVAALAAFTMGMYVYSINTFLAVETKGGIVLVSGGIRTFLFFIFFPGAFGLIGGYIVHLKGGLAYGAILRTLVLFLAFVLQVYGLWLTFSRGALLGLMVGGGLSLYLVLSGFSSVGRFNPMAKLWVRAALVLIVLGLYWNPSVGALDLKDEGFILPNTEINYRPVNKTYDVQDLEVAGTDVEFANIVNPRSLEMRLTYWQVSLLVAREHWLLGVGSGNLGTVYGSYQFLDAHPVKMTHNDYLQALAETGIFGFIFFVGFWIYFVIWGGARILKERSVYSRMALAGMYAGVVAFLIHAFFDFHFKNPSLASLMYLMAGLFYARSNLYSGGTEEGEARQSVMPRFTRWIGLAGVMILFLSGSAAARQFLYDYGRTPGTTAERLSAIGDTRNAQLNFTLSQYMLGPDVQTFYRDKVDDNGVRVPLPRRYVSDFKYFVESYEELRSLGPIRKILEGGTTGSLKKVPTRDLLDGEEITDDCIVFILNPKEAHELVEKLSKPILVRLEELDALYPHGMDTCSVAYGWTRILASAATDPEVKMMYAKVCLDWARKGVERSPNNPASYIQKSLALMERGMAEPTVKQLDYFREAVDVYRESLSFYPTEHGLIQNFALSVRMIGNEFVRAGYVEEGRKFKAEAREAENRARLLARYKYDVLGLR